MMAAFRAFAKSPWAIGLLGILIFSFGIWGVKDAFHPVIGTWVVSAGSRQLSMQDFKSDFQRVLSNIQQQKGQAITVEQAAAQGLDRQLLQRLVQDETFAAAIDQAGIRPSPELVRQELRKIPEFFNPITGAFDQAAYQQALNRAGLSSDRLLAQLNDQIAEQHFSAGMLAGMRAPLTYTAVFAAMDMQSFSADYFVIDRNAAGPPPTPTDADLQKLMASLADRLRRPETREISLVRFSAAALAQTLKADPAAVQKQFDFEKARLSTPERRSFVQILAKDAAQASAIAARLNKGEDPTAVAASYGAKALPYEGYPKTAVTDPRVADAVFKLQPGQVSGPLQGEFGFAVVKLQSITPAKPASLDDVRAQIEQEVNQRAAEEKVYDQVQKYEDVHENGSPMLQSAKAAGVTVFSLGPLTAEGHTADGQPVQGLNQKMLSDVFSLAQGGETDVIDLGKGEYYAIRVDKTNPPSLPSLDQIRPQLTALWTQQQIMQRLGAKADGYVQQLKKGASLDQVASSAGVKIQHVDAASRDAVQRSPQLQALGQEFLGRLFQAKTGDVYASAGVNYSVAVVKVAKVQPGAVADVAREAVALQPQLAQEMAQNDIPELVIAAAAAQLKPKVDEGRARQALGLPPLAASSAPTGKAP
jgi:peptidyl-prolyl cis-trans isomerase D